MTLRPQRLPRLILVLVAIGILSAYLIACGGGSDSGTSTVASSGQESSTETGKKDGVNHGRFPLPVEGGTFNEEHPGSATYHTPPLQFEADPDGKLAFTAKEVMAREGNVSIEFRNRSSTPQNLGIEGLPSHGHIVTETIQEGFTALAVTLTMDEKFIFYSALPGHRKAGMEGVIKVTPERP